jgi:DNA polymerase-3 subunit chi
MQIDFYLIKKPLTQANLVFACKLIEKAYHLGHHIFVLCDNQEQALAFDELLWSFEHSSFIPHHILGEGPTPPPPVQIGYDPKKKPEKIDILINLSTQIPDNFKQFQRICELVFEDDTLKQKKREHYKFYQGHQYKIDTHNIK